MKRDDKNREIEEIIAMLEVIKQTEELNDFHGEFINEQNLIRYNTANGLLALSIENTGEAQMHVDEPTLSRDYCGGEVESRGPIDTLAKIVISGHEIESFQAFLRSIDNLLISSRQIGPERRYETIMRLEYYVNDVVGKIQKTEEEETDDIVIY